MFTSSHWDVGFSRGPSFYLCSALISDLISFSFSVKYLSGLIVFTPSLQERYNSTVYLYKLSPAMAPALPLCIGYCLTELI